MFSSYKVKNKTERCKENKKIKNSHQRLRYSAVLGHFAIGPPNRSA